MKRARNPVTALPQTAHPFFEVIPAGAVVILADLLEQQRRVGLGRFRTSIVSAFLE